MEALDQLEHGTIERRLEVAASPEVVFEVISEPEHVREWWPDDARFEPVVGAPGELIWRDADTGETTTVAMEVVEVDPPHRFSFRWCFADETRQGPSLLVTIVLTPTPAGTLVHLTETGFREMGWEVAVLEEQFADHGRGWSHFVPRLGTYVDQRVATP